MTLIFTVACPRCHAGWTTDDPDLLLCPHCESRLYVRGRHVETDLVCPLKGRD